VTLFDMDAVTEPIWFVPAGMAEPMVTVPEMGTVPLMDAVTVPKTGTAGIPPIVTELLLGPQTSKQTPIPPLEYPRTSFGSSV
jgi:hypothetical protein